MAQAEELPVLIVGTGPLAVQVLDVLLEQQAVVYGFVRLDKTAEPTEDLDAEVPEMGAISDNAIRKMLQNEKLEYVIAVEEASIAIRLLGDLFALTHRLPVRVVSPRAAVSTRADLAQGVIILPNATVASGTVLDALVVVGANTSIGPNAEVGRAARLGTGAVLEQDVKIGEATTVGALAFVRKGAIVGAHATLGPGSVVMANVEDEAIVFGNPAKAIAK